MPAEKKPRMLLHCCCAPCTTYVLEKLLPDYNISLLFYNPNIEPHIEYEKRKNELKRLIQEESFYSNVKLLECEYDNTVFSNAVLSLRNEPEGAARCSVCFEMRLNETAKRAKMGEYDIFTSTLSVSPHKNAKLLNELGSKLAKKHGVDYLNTDFKKQNGYLRSIELSNKYNLYRQEYCGCQ